MSWSGVMSVILDCIFLDQCGCPSYTMEWSAMRSLGIIPVLMEWDQRMNNGLHNPTLKNCKILAGVSLSDLVPWELSRYLLEKSLTQGRIFLIVEVGLQIGGTSVLVGSLKTFRYWFCIISAFCRESATRFPYASLSNEMVAFVFWNKKIIILGSVWWLTLH